MLDMETENTFAQLVSWELLGRDDVNPKVLLRSIPFAQLCVVAKSVADQGRPPKDQFISEVMVFLEMDYRTGRLEGDWSYERSRDCVQLVFARKGSPPSSIVLMLVPEGGME